jgi:hypothetical protein
MGHGATDELAALDELASETGVPIPAPLAGIGQRPIRFTTTIDSNEMPDTVLAFARA